MLTVGFCELEVKLPGPLQLNVTPEVGELPERAIDVLVQVSVSPVAVAPGVALFDVTLVVAVDTQPLVGLVTVNI